MDYDFKSIESKWQARWAANKTFRVVEDPAKPKFYVLDMFPYPSGAGLHVGHPLGYIASDIFSRYKRLKGFNVLHPMGYDAFGLPAEQYAIQTGQHPEVTTEKNVARYREQLDRIGFSYDWDREVRTCDPAFYKWTQWAFLQMFDSWYDPTLDKARPIAELIAKFESTGYEDVTPAQWKAASEKEKSDILMRYRIAYQGETSVNWCEGLGTVLANDEVKDGLSVRGGYPVEQKKMTQWQLRVSAYAGRLLDSLEKLDWSDSLKEMQRNWIGRSEGTEMVFKTICDGREMPVTIFTTRADTIYGVTFMVLAPESELVDALTAADRKAEVAEYLKYVKKKTERERIAETKTVTGVFSGSYGINPVTGEKVPIWISEYVLAGYGTGAIMAVPAHDSRDYAFAKKFNLPIIPLIEGCDVSEESFDAKDQLRIPERAERQGGQRGCQGLCRGARPGPSQDQLPPARRHFLAPALLGRAFPDLLQGRHPDPAAALRAAAAPAGDRLLQAFAGRRTAARARQGLDLGRLSAREEHHAGLCGLQRLLPPLHGSAQRRRPGQPRG